MTDLYRFWNDAGRLLYIGITDRGPRRWREHMATQPWWSDVARIDLEHMPDRDTALAAERAAIIAEKPLHNVVHARTVPATAPQPAVAHVCTWQRRQPFSTWLDTHSPSVLQYLRRHHVPTDLGWLSLIGHAEERTHLAAQSFDTLADDYWRWLMSVYTDDDPFFITITDGCPNCQRAGCSCTHGPDTIPDCGSHDPYTFRCRCCGNAWRCWFPGHCFDPEANAVELWTRREDHCASPNVQPMTYSGVTVDRDPETATGQRETTDPAAGSRGYSLTYSDLLRGHAPRTPETGRVTQGSRPPVNPTATTESEKGRI